MGTDFLQRPPMGEMGKRKNPNSNVSVHLSGTASLFQYKMSLKEEAVSNTR